ncbi:MAG: hypothetical protein H0U27_10080 [Nitrosopumilus sp.]|nr:hypothetical protein [Nitrosopumilus sp.]
MNYKPFDTAPIALFVYNRPDHLKKMLRAILLNNLVSSTKLYVFSDAPKREEHSEGVQQVRNIIRNIQGFKSVELILREKNMGVAGSVTTGVTEVLKKHSTCIVLEDDIVTSQYFLTFMNDALNFYKNDKRIATISGYNYPHKIFKLPESYKEDVFFTQRVFPWGWATWTNRWNNIIWDEKYYEVIKHDKELQKKFNTLHPEISQWLISRLNREADTWSIQMTFYFMQRNMYSVFPIYSYTNNIGNDRSGSTKTKKNVFVHKKFIAPNKIAFIPLKIDNALVDTFKLAGTLKKYKYIDMNALYKKACEFYDTQKNKRGYFFKIIQLIKKLDRNEYLFNSIKYSVHTILHQFGAKTRLSSSQRPFMTENEIEFFKRNLQNDSVVLEWGSGNSTLFFSRFVKKYIAIEHHENWFDKINKKIRNNTKIIHVPTTQQYSPLLGQGWNVGFEGTYEQFKAYVDIFETLSEKFSIILIDGRARVDCAKKILPSIGEHTKVFVHDFKRYEKDLLEYYILEDRVERLALLRKK